MRELRDSPWDCTATSFVPLCLPMDSVSLSWMLPSTYKIHALNYYRAELETTDLGYAHFRTLQG